MAFPPARARAGHVYLVGAGPGDPGLLTLRARELIESCDCLLFDRLVGEEVLAFARADAEAIDVGKTGHGRQASQERINGLMVDRARRGRAVVRLKGGCPTVFGRLAEEAAALHAAAIPYQVVPGVTSALAAPACAGIPVTHRGLASSVAIVAGHCARGQRGSIAAVAHADTILILMGARSLPELVAQLVAAGRSPATPAAFVSRASRRDQATVRASLATLVSEVARAGAGSPAVVVVGAVAALGGEPLARLDGDIFDTLMDGSDTFVV